MFSEGCKSSVTTNGNVGPPCVTGLFVLSLLIARAKLRHPIELVIRL